MLNFRCDQCNQKLSVSESRTGDKVKCSRCAAAITVPHIQKVNLIKNQTQVPKAEESQDIPETGSLEEGIEKGYDASTDSDSYELKDSQEMRTPQIPANSFQDNQNHNSASGISPQTISEGGATKQCPHCGGVVLAIAKKCKHCKSFLDSPKITNDAPAAQHNSRVSDIYVGMCIVVLILSVLVNLVSLQLRIQSEGGVSVITLLLNTLLLYFDERMLKRNGTPTDTLVSVWLIPVYLFKRARLTNGSNGYAISWIIIFVISVLIELG